MNGAGRQRRLMSDDGPVSGTFLVTAADAGSALLSAVDDGWVHPLAGDTDFEVGEVVEGTLESDDPMAVTWRLAEVTARWRPAIEAVGDPPGESARAAATEAAVGQLERVPVEDGELHVLSVEPDRTETAVEEVVADETTRRIAARLGARRVEVRSEPGLVTVLYRVTESG